MNRKIILTENELTDLVHRILESKNKHVTCERCDWEWDITADDEDPYLCHMCGHRNHKEESKEGVGAYDAPAFEVEPDHVTFKHEYNEEIVIFQDGDTEKESDKVEPIRILRQKLLNKPFELNMGTGGETLVQYVIKGLGYGKKPELFWERHPDKEYVSGSVKILKVTYRGQDVTQLLLDVTNSGAGVKNEVKNEVWTKVNNLSKHFGITPKKFEVYF